MQKDLLGKNKHTPNTLRLQASNKTKDNATAANRQN